MVFSLKNRIAIIGAGASGLCAAIEARTEAPDTEIVILEKMNKAAKKILATGNGRCNFTNRDLSPKHFYGDNELLKAILTSSFADSEGFFKELGIHTYAENERVYPRSQQASTIHEALLEFIKHNNIQLRLDSPVTHIQPLKEGFSVNGEKFDCVIIATGGMASPIHGSDGSILPALKNLGHTTTPLYPALCGLVFRDSKLKLLKGVRCEAEARLFLGNKLSGSEEGEIQFTEKAVSGIPVMNLSHLCKNNKSISLELNLCPEYTEDELREEILISAKRHPEATIENLLNGFINLKLCYAIINRAGLPQNTLCKELNSRTINMLSAEMTGFTIDISGTRGFENAQVTCGGIPADEINKKTLMSLKKKGLFLCGELLDMHGDCGGYNLHLAWTSGRIAGHNAAKYTGSKV